jgi:hypothetical protein
VTIVADPPTPGEARRKAALYSDPTRKPAVLAPDLDGVPTELRELVRWVVWRLVWKANKKDGGKWDKPPFQPSGKPAKTNDPRTWTTFDKAAAAYQTGRFDGIGFVLGDGFAGIDLDDVRDACTGAITSEAAALVERFATYTEASPSGFGLKLVGRGEWRADWHKKPFPGGGEVEGYSTGRYFTVTGRPVGCCPVADIQPAVDELAARLAAPAASADPTKPNLPGDDDELIRRAVAAGNGAKFARLWAGDPSEYGGDDSRADLALCGMLAFWTGPDAARIDWLFRRSGLMRPKWDERRGAATYGQRTVEKALSGKTEFYAPGPGKTGRRGTAGAGGGEKPKSPPAVEVLTRIGLELDLWHDPTGSGYATAGRRSHPLRSKGFRQFLVNEYRKRTGGKVPTADGVSAALVAIEGAAVYDRPEHPAHVRLAGHAGRVYLCLADPASTVVEIDAAGWRVCEMPPVRFRKPPGMLSLPMPERGGALADLRRFLNVPDDDGFALAVGWVMGCFLPDGPFPLLVGYGEQGSAKTTTAKVLKHLIDPSAAAVRCGPREPRDLMIQARNNWILAFDNLSTLPGWLSDAFCRLATGGGFSTRELHTDDEEVIFDAKRPLILNGIEDFVTRGDLLERALRVAHRPIREEDRRAESAFWAEFESARPGLLGAVLDRVSAGLLELPRVVLDRLPRMADFALFAVACERGSGEARRFVRAYAENQAGAHEQALDGSPLPPALLALVDGKPGWEGSPGELLAELTKHTTDPMAKDWPKKSNVLTNRLRRLAPNLRRVYRLDVDCDGRESGGKSDGKRSRVVRVARLPEMARERSSPPSPCPPPPRETPPAVAEPTGDGPGGRSAASGPDTVSADRPPSVPANGRQSKGNHGPGDDGDDVPRGSSACRFRSDDRPHESRG